MTPESWRDEFAIIAYDKVRYSDTDRQGHVNNTVFATFLETGRVEVLYNPDDPMFADDAEFVIVASNLNLEGEIHWPGTVDIGSRVAKLGTSSITLEQALFQNNRQVASAQTVLVQINSASRKAQPLSDQTRARLKPLMIGGSEGS